MNQKFDERAKGLAQCVRLHYRIKTFRVCVTGIALACLLGIALYVAVSIAEWLALRWSPSTSA